MRKFKFIDQGYVIWNGIYQLLEGFYLAKYEYNQLSDRYIKAITGLSRFELNKKLTSIARTAAFFLIPEKVTDIPITLKMSFLEFCQNLYPESEIRTKLAIRDHPSTTKFQREFLEKNYRLLLKFMEYNPNFCLTIQHRNEDAGFACYIDFQERLEKFLRKMKNFVLAVQKFNSFQNNDLSFIQSHPNEYQLFIVIKAYLDGKEAYKYYQKIFDKTYVERRLTETEDIDQVYQYEKSDTNEIGPNREPKWRTYSYYPKKTSLLLENQLLTTFMARQDFWAIWKNSFPLSLKILLKNVNLKLSIENLKFLGYLVTLWIVNPSSKSELFILQYLVNLIREKERNLFDWHLQNQIDKVNFKIQFSKSKITDQLYMKNYIPKYHPLHEKKLLLEQILNKFRFLCSYPQILELDQNLIQKLPSNVHNLFLLIGNEENSKQQKNLLQTVSSTTCCNVDNKNSDNENSGRENSSNTVLNESFWENSSQNISVENRSENSPILSQNLTPKKSSRTQSISWMKKDQETKGFKSIPSDTGCIIF